MMKLFSMLFFLWCAGAAPVAGGGLPTVAGLPPEEALPFGEKMYREGILPSGESMLAYVQEDIPVDGTMFSCDGCHLRSGLGSVEGNVVTPPTNGAKLLQSLPEERTYQARKNLPGPFQGVNIRSPYTDETLARALWEGENPDGRELDFTMPRYSLSEREMEIMVFYLKNLSMKSSPGVTDTTIHFATVVTEGVSTQDRDAMLAPLKAYVTDKNSQVRNDELRAKQGVFYKRDNYTPYRRLSLSVWELKGPPQSWSGQLQAYYRKEPVFALLGGIAAGDWAPIHRFCEEQEIPSIFPVTDYPVISETDWYTVYFSKGLYQEGEAAARYLRGEEAAAAGERIVQVFRDRREGRTLAKAFRETWQQFGQVGPEERPVAAGEVVDANFWQRLASRYPGAVLLLWLGSEDLQDIEVLAATGPKMVFASASLLGDDLNSLPDQVRGTTFITYPHRLPQAEQPIQRVVKRWLQVRGIPVTNLRIQSKMYFLGRYLSNIITRIQDDYYRDYFLDMIDMMKDEYYVIANYPRLSFGQGQRYASKGCYIVQLAEGPSPELVKKSGWVIH